jgi:hypothetical protein
MARMKDGFDKVDRGAGVAALLSRSYQESDYCLIEAHHALAGDPMNKKQRLIVLRIEDCVPTGWLRAIPYVDLVPLLHDADALARAVRGAIDGSAPEADFAALHRRLPAQDLHPEIRPVPGFAEREELLSAIDTALWEKGRSAGVANAPAYVAVIGQGGVGKSALAREYALRRRGRYHGVWWVRGETEQTINEDLLELGNRLIPNLDKMAAPERAVHLALDAIGASGAGKPWLIVYDNVEKPGAIARRTPAATAHILVTSRWPRWQGHAEELPVGVFPEDAAVDFLLDGRQHVSRAAAVQLARAGLSAAGAQPCARLLRRGKPGFR